MKEVYSSSYYIRRFFSLPLHIGLKKVFAFIKAAVFSKIEKIKVIALGADINDREFKDSLKEGLPGALKGFRERTAVFLPAPEAGGFRNIFRDYPEEAKSIISGADRICEHKFDLLGSGEVYLGEKIDWHTDFKTGYRWDPVKFYRNIEIPYGKGDIKIPWELSRFQHLILLGEAYQLTGDEKYACEFKKQVSDWIESNPPKRGLNWACTMDAAIRAANWLVAWEYFKKSLSFDDDFIRIFLKSILVHGRFIKNNPEYSEELTSNHYISDIAGLFFIACMAPGFKESGDWLFFTVKELESEIRKQVYEDGCDFEASTCYHRLVLELFLYSALLGKKTGIEFSREYNSRLKKMFEAVRYLLKPNGRMPQIGDNDSGRFLRFDPPGSEVLDMRYVLALGAIFFDEPELKAYESDHISAAALSVFGRKSIGKLEGMAAKGIEEVKSHAFSDSGWFVMRNSHDYLLVSCGPNGQNSNGGHGHNDKLSFELCLKGEDIIVDPGTCVYTSSPDVRNLFRSTKYHNTIEVDGEEQNRFHPGFLFAMDNDSGAKALKWVSNEDEDFFSGEHYGYKRLLSRVIHRRDIKFSKKSCEVSIVDMLSGNGEASFSWNLHFSPGCKVDLNKNIAYIRTPSGEKNQIEMLSWVHLEKESYRYSGAYGLRENAESIRFISISQLPISFEWKIKRGTQE